MKSVKFGEVPGVLWSVGRKRRREAEEEVEEVAFKRGRKRER